MCDEATAGSCSQPDPDAVPCRQVCHREQAHVAGDLDVRGGRVLQAPVHLPELFLRHPHSAVNDVDQHSAAPERMARHGHLSALGRERGGVLNDLGQQMHDVSDRVPGHADAGLYVQDDPVVLLDLRHGRTGHVRERHWLRPPAWRLLARQHKQVLRVAAQARGQVIHPEQVGQPLGVLLPEFQAVDQSQQPFQE
jgi:hypothetical protein